MVFPFTSLSASPRPANRRSPYRLAQNFVGMGCLAWLFVVVGLIPLKTAVTHYQVPHPQAILVLGGNPAREVFTAHFIQSRPNLPVWLSSGMEEGKARTLFESVNGTSQQITIDRQAVDTVTNFTTLVDQFKQRGLRHVFLITSDYHMTRARTIASLVLGSKGIVHTAIAVPSSRPSEPRSKTIRDFCRSLIWVFTGWSGESLKNADF